MTSRTERLLDETGWRLLRALQENGRLSYSELGRRVGLTTPAVVERVRRLEDVGIITGYHAEIDPEKVGMPITAFMRISAPADRRGHIGARARGLPEVLECHRITGNDSFILKAVVASIPHLEALIDQMAPFGHLATSVVLSSPVTGRIITDEARHRIANGPSVTEAAMSRNL